MSNALHHLNLRVAWHDQRWNGHVCAAPSKNSYCLDLDRIRTERNDGAEDSLKGEAFWNLKDGQFPPCQADSGAFMNEKTWWRTFQHPYQDIEKAQATHGKLIRTPIKVPPYSTFAVPFRWMLRENQRGIEEKLCTPLPPDDEPPFKTSWVYARERQTALCELFFSSIVPNKSLVFFYTKNGHPLDESINRLVVGVGQIEWMTKIQLYEATEGPRYPLWDRLFTHSIRPDGAKGTLLPYHDYLEPTGDPDEDERRKVLLNDIAVVPEAIHTMAFSHVGEHATHDIALSTLVRTLEAIRKVRQHGIASGPWEKREEWLNEQIHTVWQQRGAFPGAGAALEALGMRLGTSMMFELLAKDEVKPTDDPWLVLDAILRGEKEPPQAAYKADIEAVAATWGALPKERSALLKLLSRFDLSPAQSIRWFDARERKKATRGQVDDKDILENPYRIVECDLGDASEHPVSLGAIDRGLLPDATIAANHPVPEPSRVGAPLDWRRVRGAFVSLLRQAAIQGDALLTEDELLDQVATLDLVQPCPVSSDWINGNVQRLETEIARFPLKRREKDEVAVLCLQLTDVQKREKHLARLLAKRTQAAHPSLNEPWDKHLRDTIKEQGVTVDLSEPRYVDALTEQAKALERITTRKLSVLVGGAGTGKTTVLGAVKKSSTLARQGILFLAPTGKARVRLGQKTGDPSMTVAQFLYQQKRYDAARQRPLFDGPDQYAKEKTVVIDECSMLTMDDLYAVLVALDLAHVQRLILVGDPNQLPPIGIGRPLADLVAFLDEAAQKQMEEAKALARLSVEVRTSAGAPSDSLRLASWFTREPQPVDADRVLSDLEIGREFNDLEVHFWNSPQELHTKLLTLFCRHLDLKDASDVEGFNRAMGLTTEGWIPFDDHDGAENFQLLSPVRKGAHGVFELNRWIQTEFRSAQLKSSRQPWGLSLGDEEIVWGDKVILTRNGKRDGWNGKEKKTQEEYLANGEIGLAAFGNGNMRNKALNVAFAGRPDVRYAFWPNNFKGDNAPLELAYALTVHKSQGSDFGKVFVVVPRRSRLLTRELIYTALTRSKDRLILLLEGTDISPLNELIKASETARRSTNLFAVGVRDEAPQADTGGKSAPDRYASHLIYRTTRGEMVRSKSELIIAEKLNSLGIKYSYERPLEGIHEPGQLRPDFSFVDDGGNVFLWEHLGRMDLARYREGWTWKKHWYSQNGYSEDSNLFTSTEEQIRDIRFIDDLAHRIQKLLD
ncbi:AAA family ATPase [Rhodopseudomonas sp. BR0C11]|uniref:AAA family ATPase n=1 Tax=Rhodopseudomonas sp. BR0C11 TaxID=2269370 RepID=UPI0013DFB123|nr:AAA family ATPase [Rhodopseudomonas sp. BR0C11]NEV75924.1 AAA family ATPase [Rhodopseudomonas sp. BR0C11]